MTVVETNASSSSSCRNFPLLEAAAPMLLLLSLWWCQPVSSSGESRAKYEPADKHAAPRLLCLCREPSLEGDADPWMEIVTRGGPTAEAAEAEAEAPGSGSDVSQKLTLPLPLALTLLLLLRRLSLCFTPSAFFWRAIFCCCCCCCCRKGPCPGGCLTPIHEYASTSAADRDMAGAVARDD